jgi:hypothetical protein
MVLLHLMILYFNIDLNQLVHYLIIILYHIMINSIFHIHNDLYFHTISIF